MASEHRRTQPEPPCVWSTAGVLDYRPCGREYECDGCPLYLALRGGGAGPEALSAPVPAAGDSAVDRYLVELGSGCTLHLDRAYSAHGLWIDGGAGGPLELGLDEFTLRLLQPVDGIVLPRVGVWLKRYAPCAWVNRGRLAISLRCPIAGEVAAVHPRPVTRSGGSGGPGRPAGDRWWIRLKAHELLAAAAVYRHEGLLAWYLRRFQVVREHLDAVTAGGTGIAARTAVADGGLPERNLEVVLGRERFEALVGALFPMRG